MNHSIIVVARGLNRYHAILWLCLALVALTMAPSGATAEPAEPTIWVSILPQQWFAEQLLSDRAEVHVLLQPEQSPHTYDPSPRQLAALFEADIFFMAGVPFESALVPRLKDMYPDLRIVDVRQGIQLRSIDDGHHHHHDSHDHGNHDPHFWLDPSLAVIMAENMAHTFCGLDSAHCQDYLARLASLRDSLATIDSTTHAMLDPHQGRKLYVYHAAFGYWCDAYGLKQVPIEVGGKQPGPRKVARLIEDARADSVRTIFVQPQFSESSAEAIASAINGKVIAIDPLAANYPQNLLRMARAVAEGLKRGGDEHDR